MIVLFGNPGIKIDGTIVRELPIKVYLAIAVLADKPGGMIRRSVLASWLWENSTTKQAFANLRQLLAKVRKFEQKYGLKILQNNQGFVCLNTGVQIDYHAFFNIDTITTQQEISDFVSRFSSGIFNELNVTFGEDLSTWIATFQKQCDDQFLQVSLAGIDSADKDHAIKLLSTILSCYPHHEPACIALLRRYAFDKKWQKVRSTFATFSNQLKSNLDAVPSNALLSLYARLMPAEIPELEQKFGYLSSALEASLPLVDSLPRLLVVSNHRNDNRASKGIQALTLNLTHSLTQMRCFSIISPSLAHHMVANDYALPPLATDFILTITDTGNGVNVMVTCLYTSDVLFSQMVLFSSLNHSENTYELVAKSIQNAINAGIVRNATKSGIWYAYQLYLSAERTLTFGDLPSIRSARKKLRETLRLFPTFYLAKQLLARTYYLEWFSLGRLDITLLIEAKKLATSLIKSDPTASAGYWELSTALLYLGNLTQALATIDQALVFSPNNAGMVAHKSDVLCHLGRYDEALPEIDRALQLNLTPPDEYYWIRAGILFLKKDYQNALNDTLRSKNLIPFNWRILAACYAMLGDDEHAKISRIAHLDEYPDFSVSEWEKSFPLKQKQDIEHYALAMRRAGFH